MGTDAAGQFREQERGVCYLTMAGVIEHAMVCWVVGDVFWETLESELRSATGRIERGEVLTR